MTFINRSYGTDMFLTQTSKLVTALKAREEKYTSYPHNDLSHSKNPRFAVFFKTKTEQAKK